MATSLTASELRSSSPEELTSKLAEAKEELFNLRFQSATGQLESHGRLRAVRKEIARIYTVLRERELGIIIDVEDETLRTSKGARSEHQSGRDGCRRAAAGCEQRGYRKTREGLVVSDKMDKTVVVAVEDRVKHPKYGKVMRRTKKYKAHDEKNECGVGDRVLLMETRPLSATKRWRVAEILERAKYSQVDESPAEHTGVTKQELT